MAQTWTGLRNLYVVRLDDKTEYTIQSGIPDVIRWERNNKRGYMDTGSPTTEQMLWTAWAAGRRQKVLPDEFANFDQFFNRVEDFAITDPEETEPDPTRPVPTDA